MSSESWRCRSNSTSGVKQEDNLAHILLLFAIQATIDTMNNNWSSLFATPATTFRMVPKCRKTGGHLNKRSSSKWSTPLDHKDIFYEDDSAWIYLPIKRRYHQRNKICQVLICKNWSRSSSESRHKIKQCKL